MHSLTAPQMGLGHTSDEAWALGVPMRAAAMSWGAHEGCGGHHTLSAWAACDLVHDASLTQAHGPVAFSGGITIDSLIIPLSRRVDR